MPAFDGIVLHLETRPYAMTHEQVIAKFDELREKFIGKFPTFPPPPTRYERRDPVSGEP